MMRVLRVQLKSANEKVTFHQERRKRDHGKKVLLDKVKIAAEH